MKNKRKNNWFMWEVKLSEIVRCFPFCMSRFIPSFFFCVWKFFHHGKKILNTKGQNVRKSTYFLTCYTNKASQSGINMSESNIDSALAKLRRAKQWTALFISRNKIKRAIKRRRVAPNIPDNIEYRLETQASPRPNHFRKNTLPKHLEEKSMTPWSKAEARLYPH